MARYDYLFSESAVRGLTSAQFIARCGEPPYANQKGSDVERFEGEPLWTVMKPAAREKLLACHEFMFGYYGFFGDQYSVWFKDGRVDHIVRSSK